MNKKDILNANKNFNGSKLNATFRLLYVKKNAVKVAFRCQILNVAILILSVTLVRSSVRT